MCTDDANGCYGHGTCATDTGVCTCESGWTGSFCGTFDTSVVDVDTTVAAVEISTGTTCSSDYTDSEHPNYIALANSVSAAAQATFEDSAASGYVLKAVSTILGGCEGTTTRRKRSTSTVTATTSLTIEHAKTNAETLSTFVDTEFAASTALVDAGFTAASAEITTSTDSGMIGLSDGQIVGIVIGVCGSVLLAFVLFMVWSK